MSRYALLLLLLGTSALLLSVVDAQGQSGNNGNNGGSNGGGNSNNNKGKSNSARDEAVTANKVGKPKKGAAGSINGTLKSDMFTTCFNKINQDMAVRGWLCCCTATLLLTYLARSHLMHSGR